VDLETAFDTVPRSDTMGIVDPLLCVIVMAAISRELRVALPSELLYADDLAVIAETEEDLINRLNKWKNNVQNRGMRVNVNTSGYTTWFTAGGAIRITHYDVIDDVITRKL